VGELGDLTLGSPQFQTGFALFAKRIDTGSPWSLSNNPRARYWAPETALANGLVRDPSLDVGSYEIEGAEPDPSFSPELETFFPNRDYRVSDIVRASAAAPTFFDEVAISLGHSRDADGNVVARDAKFMDGALGGHNNPALQLFVMATSGRYGFNWSAREDQLFVCSVGTGHWRPVIDEETRKSFPGKGLIAAEAMQAVEALRGLVTDTGSHVTAVLQSISRPRKRWRINSEYLGGGLLTPEPLLTFQRYDVRLDPKGLHEDFFFQYDDETLNRLRRLDQSDEAFLHLLHGLGRKAGEKFVEAQDFPTHFDLDGSSDVGEGLHNEDLNDHMTALTEKAVARVKATSRSAERNIKDRMRLLVMRDLFRKPKA
jgi:uncharacterized protein